MNSNQNSVESTNKKIKAIQQELLQRTIDYVENYSVAQMESTRSHIDRMNSLITNTIDGSKIQKYAASLKVFTENYAFLLEQSTVLWQAAALPIIQSINTMEGSEKDTLLGNQATKSIEEVEAIYEPYKD